MTDNHQALLTVLIVFSLEAVEFLVVRRDDGHVYPPKIGWRLFYFVVIAALLFDSVEYVAGIARTPKDPPLWLLLLMFVAFFFTRPRTLVANSTGLGSYHLYGFRRRFVSWVEVSGVTSDWEEGRGGLLWAIMARGYCVAVTSRIGTCIEHTFRQKHQGKFLEDLRQHVPASAFAPGLFEWHPERS